MWGSKHSPIGINNQLMVGFVIPYQSGICTNEAKTHAWEWTANFCYTKSIYF